MPATAVEGVGLHPDTAGALPHVLKQGSFVRYLVTTFSWSSGHQLVFISNSFLLYDMTSSTLWLAALGAAMAVPQFVLSGVGGMLADRFPRKWLLAVGSAVGALLMATLAVLAFTNALEPWHIVAAGVGFGAALGSDWTARQAFITNLVHRRQLIRAVSFDQSVFHTGRVVAPVLGGFLLAVIGGRGTFSLGAILFATSVLLVLSLRPRQEVAAHHPPVWQDIREAVSILRAEPVLPVIIMFTAMNGLLLGGFIYLAPVFAKDILGGGATVQGAITGGMGFGAVAGAIWFGSRSGIRGAGMWLLLSNALFVLAIGGYSMSVLLVASVALAAAAGLFNVIHLTVGIVTIQTRVSDHARGRVFGVYEMAWGFFPVGGIVFGALAAGLGPEPALLGGAAAVAAVTLAVALFSRRTRTLQFEN